MNFASACLTLASGHKETTVILWLLILLPLSAVSVRSQGQITALEKDLTSADPTTEVTCIRYPTKRAEREVTVSMALGIGDELRSTRGTVTVRARCGAGTELTLSGPFRVRWLRSSNQGCSIYSYPKAGGRVNVSSSVPTDVQSGEIRLATRRTRYEIKTGQIWIPNPSKRRRAPARIKILAQQLLAYEDEVSVKLPGKSTRVVAEGAKLITTGKAVARVDKIALEDVAQTASDDAKLDVSHLAASYSQAKKISAYFKLKGLHEEVLANPGSLPKQLELKTERIKFGIPVAKLTPSTIGPAFDRGPTTDTKTSADTKTPTDTKTPADTKTPTDTKTPADTKTPTDTKPPADTKTPTDTKPPADTKTPTDTKPPTGIKRTNQFAFSAELEANAKTVKSYGLRNVCGKMVRIHITEKLRFGKVVSDEVEIAPGGVTQISIEFDTTRTKPGDHKGELFLTCLNCAAADKCFPAQSRIPVYLHVKEEKRLHMNNERLMSGQPFMQTERSNWLKQTIRCPGMNGMIARKSQSRKLRSKLQRRMNRENSSTCSVRSGTKKPLPVLIDESNSSGWIQEIITGSRLLMRN